tara:strand:+ start:972 stop:1244 length:273 start_codon:yes stop_codon:yes gene_type:complete
MLEKSMIENRLTTLNHDIQKVANQLQELDKQKTEATAMIHALNGAKQQCLNFLEEINNEHEPEDSDSGDVGNNADSNIPPKDNPVLSGLI